MLGVEKLTKSRSVRRRLRTLRCVVAAALWVLPAAASALVPSHEGLTVEQLKARISDAPVADKARICVEIAEKQLVATDNLYAADDLANAQPALTDVVTYSELARDYSIQSHKHQKQIEISVRTMTRKLHDLLHTLGQEDQGPIKEAIGRLERVRDDLLASMFPKGAK